MVKRRTRCVPVTSNRREGLIEPGQASAIRADLSAALLASTLRNPSSHRRRRAPAAPPCGLPRDRPLCATRRGRRPCWRAMPGKCRRGLGEHQRGRAARRGRCVALAAQRWASPAEAIGRAPAGSAAMCGLRAGPLAEPPGKGGRAARRGRCGSTTELRQALPAGSTGEPPPAGGRVCIDGRPVRASSQPELSGAVLHRHRSRPHAAAPPASFTPGGHGSSPAHKVSGPR